MPQNLAMRSVPGLADPGREFWGYFKPAGTRHRGAKALEAGGLLRLGILADASLETMLVMPWALIARTT